MRYKDVPRGHIFQFTPQPGTRYTAIKSAHGAYLLQTWEQVTIHANKDCDEIRREYAEDGKPPESLTRESF